MKRLLILVKSNPEYFRLGLCHWILNLWVSRKINQREYYKLKAFLDEHTPSQIQQNGYWWNVGEIEPRLRWLDEMIPMCDKPSVWDRVRIWWSYGM